MTCVTQHCIVLYKKVQILINKYWYLIYLLEGHKYKKYKKNYNKKLKILEWYMSMHLKTLPWRKDSNTLKCNNSIFTSSANISHRHNFVTENLMQKKRMPSDEVDDELGSSQISPAQLSSNKLTRHSDKNQFSWFQIVIIVFSWCY